MDMKDYTEYMAKENKNAPARRVYPPAADITAGVKAFRADRVLKHWM